MTIPQGAESFERDILDDIIEWENNVIISQDEERQHTDKCSGFTQCIKSDDQISQCCQPQTKLFNRYNQRSYTDQPIELPFDLNANLNQSIYC